VLVHVRPLDVQEPRERFRVDQGRRAGRDTGGDQFGDPLGEQLERLRREAMRPLTSLIFLRQ
jgi:hypothetical protein